jgi:hypothetical protein
MTRSKTSRTAVAAAIGTALTVAISTVAFAPAFAATGDPVVTWTSQISNGEHFTYGSVPAAPTCAAVTEANQALTCTIQGYSVEVGEHTLSAVVDVPATEITPATQFTDPATVTYTVDAYTLKGFYKPVKMDARNTRKAGSTVPLKFKVYVDGVKEKTPEVIKSFLAQKIDCTTSAPTADPAISLLTGSKGQSLKYYDGAFHRNWKTPKLDKAVKVKGKKVVAPVCYAVTMTTQDGSALTASFLLK